DATELPASSRVIRFPECPGRAYITALSRDFNGTSPLAAQEFLMSLQTISGLTVEALPSVATQIANVDGLSHVFFANFTGLIEGENPVPSPDSHARIIVAGSGQAYFLRFLGEIEELRGKSDGGKTTFVLPSINRGAVVWWSRALTRSTVMARSSSATLASTAMPRARNVSSARSKCDTERANRSKPHDHGIEATPESVSYQPVQ